MQYSSNHSQKQVLKKLVKSAILSLPIMFLSLSTAYADFPTEEQLGPNYFNHVASGLPGKNLIVNPSFGIIACDDYEDAVKAAVSAPCNAGVTGNTVRKWSWDSVLQANTGGKTNDNYNPPGATVNNAYIGRVAADKTGTLSEAIYVEGASEIYVQYYANFNDRNGPGNTATVNLVLLSETLETTRTEELAHYTTHGTKGITTSFITLSEPYTGLVNLEIINDGALKILIDNVFLSTDAVITPPAVGDIVISADLDDDSSIITTAISSDSEDTLNYTWTVSVADEVFEYSGSVASGTEISSSPIDESPYDPATPIKVVLVVTGDSNPDNTYNYTWYIATNSPPTVTLSIITNGTQDAVFMATAADIDNDNFVITWEITGISAVVPDDTEVYTLNFADYAPGAVLVEVTVTVTDVNRPTYTSSATESFILPALSAVTVDVESGAAGSGSTTGWLVLLLTAGLIGRRRKA
jgi:hypothetical protein